MKHDLRFATFLAPGAAAWAILCAAALAVAAQEPVRPGGPPPEGTPKPERPEKPPLELPPLPGGAENDQQRELVELFGKVERRLRAIDTQMYEAAAGRVPTKPVAGSGIEELLREGKSAKTPENVAELLQSASQDSRQTQSDILRILQIAESMNSKSGSGSGGKPKPGSGGKSPLDQQGSTPQGREETPTLPGEKPGGKPPGGKEPEGGDGMPEDGKRPDDPNQPAENRPGGKPPEKQQGPGTGADGADRWGDLPVRTREIFRVEGASDLPPQYRDWIDGYYRRLQSLERR